MTAHEISFHWTCILVFVLHATAEVLSPAKDPASEFYVLYLQNPITLYRDSFVYSVPGDDSGIYHIVPKHVVHSKHHNNGQYPRISVSDNGYQRHLIRNNVVSRETADSQKGFTRREKVFPRYSRSYLKPILTTTSTRYENPWKPIKNDDSTFDIKISKSIQVSEPKTLNRPSEVRKEHSPYDSSSNERLPSFHFNITFTDPESGGVPESRHGRFGGKYHSLEHNHPVTPSWRPFSIPINLQNSTSPFRKSKIHLQDPRTLPSNYSDNNYKEVVYHGNRESGEDNRGRKFYNDSPGAQISHSPHAFSSRPTPPYDMLFPSRVTTEFASETPFVPSDFQRVVKNPEGRIAKKMPRQNITNIFTPVWKITSENRHNSSLNKGGNDELSITSKNVSFNTQPLFDHKISVSNHGNKPEITYYTSEIDEEKSSEPASRSNKFSDKPFQNIVYNDSVSNIVNKTINNAHFVYPSLKNNMETIQIARKVIPIFKDRAPSVSSAKPPNNYHSFTTKEGTFFEVNLPTNLFSPMKKNVTFDDKPGTSASSPSDLRKQNEPDFRETEHVNVKRLPPPTPEIITNKPPATQKPKVKLTAGFLAGVLIAALVFLGFLIGTSIYASHQCKYGKHRKNKKKTNYSSEYLDDTFVGNTYLHNNIYLPTPQNIEEVASVDSDSFINGIEAITSENYSSENSRNTTV